MKATKQIDIYVTNKHNVRVIDVVQYDTGVQLVFTVKDFTIPSGATATLYVQKPSGKFVFQEDGIIISGNTVTINLDNQSITEHGKVSYQVSLKSDADVITTFTGFIMVEKSQKDEGAVKSKTVIRAFDEAVSDHVTEFQTKAEQIVQACIATIPADYTVMEAKVNNTANAIKGSVSGAVVSIDDVSTVEHNPAVKVHGKNLIPFPYSEESITRDGATFTVNDDGGISLSGTATINTSFNLVMQYKKTLPIKKGRKYTLSCDSTFTVATGYVYFQNWANGVGVDSLSVRNGSVTFEASQDGYVQIGIVLLKGQTYNETVYIQLEEGSVATEYVPYIDPSTVKVRRCGKNIFGVAAKSQTINGVTFTVNTNGSVTATGTAEKTTFIGLGSLVLKPDEQYRLSGSPAGSDFDTYLLYIHNNTTGADIYDLGEGKVFTGKAGDLGVTIAVYAGNTVNNLLFRPMVVYGEESGSFEPYNGATYTTAADGTVASMTSLSPNMTILTDTEGVIVECEYNVDTKTYIDKKISEMLKGGV